MTALRSERESDGPSPVVPSGETRCDAALGEPVDVAVEQVEVDLARRRP